MTNLGQLEILVGNAKALYPFILHYDGFWGIVEPHFDEYWRFNNYDTPWRQFFMNLGYFFYLFGHWVQISDNWRSWLHIQKVYTHSYFTLVDCGAFWKHIVTNNGDFVILTPPGANLFYEFGIFCHLFGHWWQSEDNCRSGLQMQKLYIHSYFTFIDFGALKKYILKNIDDFLILTPFNIKSQIMAVFTNLVK